ncbi:hypothetical protein D9757_013492 [Collybiopsis confluens]|uniref:chitin deacetylase n=1 Tax=Collybiopsis confluens TaxID=2823264 RepID=A0A8H5CS18_9AGAR|nr:hypothetical protein D9757_013492 [Collybiopsis confluens]
MQLENSSLRRLVLTSLAIGLLRLVDAQAAPDRSSEAGEAAITDPTAECQPYDYPPVSSQTKAFPGNWVKATILAGDTAAQAKWNSISGSIPTNISVKTQPPPSSYSSSDPDCWWTYNLCTDPKLHSLPPDIASAPEPSTLGYGFDDGPNCGHNVFYNFLLSQNQKATFYFIGSNVQDYPLEAQRALAEDTWSHPYMTTFSSEDAFAELWYCASFFVYGPPYDRRELILIYLFFAAMQMIKLAVGVTPTCWRPPYGDVDDRIRSIAHGLGLTTIMWKYDTADASVDGKTITDQTVINNYNNFINQAKNGSFSSTGAILLTHELNNFTMSEAVTFYPQLKSVFQHIAPVGVTLNKTQPYVESNYSLPTFGQYISGTKVTNGSSLASPNSSTTDSPSSTAASSSSATSSASDSPNGQSVASSNGALGTIQALGYESFGLAMLLVNVAICGLW